MMYVSNIIPVNLFGYKMTTKVVETITPLYTTARLKRELFSFTSLVSDAVFEDNFDSLDNLIRTMYLLQLLKTKIPFGNISYHISGEV